MQLDAVRRDTCLPMDEVEEPDARDDHKRMTWEAPELRCRRAELRDRGLPGLANAGLDARARAPHTREVRDLRNHGLCGVARRGQHDVDVGIRLTLPAQHDSAH